MNKATKTNVSQTDDFSHVLNLNEKQSSNIYDELILRQRAEKQL